MASPQIQNGYIKIANELWDQICRTRIRAEYRQMLDFIIRKTYGFNKSHDYISTTQIINGTGLTRSAIGKARKWLKENKYITVTQNRDSQILKYSINKRYGEWKLSPKKGTVPLKGMELYPLCPQTVPLMPTPTITKDTLQKTTKDRGGKLENACGKPVDNSIKRFTPPSLSEVQKVIKNKNYNVDAETFIAFYEAKGWMIGKNKMKSWKAALVTWQNRSGVVKNNASIKKEPNIKTTSDYLKLVGFNE